MQPVRLSRLDDFPHHEDWIEGGISYEVAESLLGLLIALCLERAREAKANVGADSSHFREWKTRQRHYSQERKNLYKVDVHTLPDRVKLYGDEFQRLSETK